MIKGRVDPDFWRGRRVLLTGHTGFKGGWLAIWLSRMGAEITGLALSPETSPSLFNVSGIERLMARSVFVDIRDAFALASLVRETQPEVVLHLAAQPLVRRSYREPLSTFSTNLMGTANLLEALRSCVGAKVAVMVTTDKVYANSETATPYSEDHPLGGHDPYSASKAASEIVIDSYRSAFLSLQGVAVASARAGNVIGGGDWSEDRLIPDVISAWNEGKVLEIRRPDAIRPWQHVLEPIAGYLVLSQHLWHDASLAGAFNFGPSAHDAASVRDVISHAQRAWPSSTKVAWGDGTSGPHEASKLILDTAKAQSILGVQGVWTTCEAVHRTVNWYLKYAAGDSALALCHEDITDFISKFSLNVNHETV